MTLFDDYKNMHNELVNKKRTPKLKQELQKKYNKLFVLSEKLFDKIYDINCSSNDLLIIEKMIKMKIENDKGNITKLNADKAIGETLCDVYVKPMLDKNKK
tara:strand:- start:223 stop:525 length:303 start_codon:yes stop_codon:yes gene_type:complete